MQQTINNDYNPSETTVFIVDWLIYGCDQMTESFIHFTLRCIIYVITIVMFGITTVTINQSIIAVVYFIFFSTYCTIFQVISPFFN